METQSPLDLVYHRLFRQPLGFSLDLADYASLSTLTLAPATTLIGLCPLFLFQYQNEREMIVSGDLLWAKMAAGIALVSIELLNMAISASLSATHSDLPFHLSLTRCVAAVCLLAMIYSVHKRTCRSSAIMSTWFIVAIVCDITRARICPSSGKFDNFLTLAKASAALKAVLLVLEELPKSRYIADSHVRQKTRWQSTCGLLTRNLIVWPCEELSFGFRHVDSIGQLDQLDPELASEHLAQQFSANWSKANKGTSNCLAKVCFFMLFPSIFTTAACRGFVFIFEFSQPFYLYCVLSFMETNEKTQHEKNRLIATAAVVYLGQTISKAAYTYSRRHLAVLLRGTLTTAIYEKTMTLVQSEADKATAVTLLSTEMQTLLDKITLLFDGFAAFLEVSSCIYLAVLLNGIVSIIFVLPSLAAAFAGWYIGKRLPLANKLWTESTNRRVALTSKLLPQIQAIKMMGLDKVVLDIFDILHSSELDASLDVRFWVISTLLTAIATNTFIGPVLITSGLLWNTQFESLTLRNIFTMAAISTVIFNPLFMIINNPPRLGLFLEDLRRIQEFLLIPEWSDMRDRSKAIHDQNTESASRSNLQYTRRVIEIYNGCLTLQSNNKPVLSSVHVTLNQGEILMVAGPAKSGKTTFLLTLIGEGKIISGSVYVAPGKVAYCGQVAWLPNLTICNIITAELAFDRGRYDDVLEACCLREDLEMFQDYDQTNAGYNRLKFSLGLQQKIALARAVYSVPSILVVDDVLSTLDLATATEIFSRLFGTHGLLRNSGTTVVMATRSIPFLQTADRVLIIGADGKSALHDYSTDLEFHTRLAKLANQIEADSQTMKGNVVNESIVQNVSLADKVLDSDQEKLAPHQYLLLYLRSFPSIIFAVCIVTAFLSAVTELGGAAYLRIGVDSGLRSTWFYAGYWLFSAFNFVTAGACLSLWFFRAVPASTSIIHRQTLNTLLNSTIDFLSYTDSEIFLNLFKKDITPISRDIPNLFIKVIYALFITIFHTSMIALATPQVLLTLAFVAIAGWIVLINYIRISRNTKYMNSTSPLDGYITETATGLRYIRLFGWKDQRMEAMYKLVDDYQKLDCAIHSLNRWLSVSTHLIAFTVGMIVVWCAASSEPTSSAVAVALVSLMSFAHEKTSLVEKYTALDGGLESVGRIHEFIESTPREEDHEEAIKPLKSWPHNGKVLMENVSATYSRKNGLPPVLENVTVYIPGGWKVGVVGRAGSGKTSLILTLLNFLDYSGRIVIDGVDISKVPRRILRERIITISQDSLDFDGTVRSTLCPWRLNNTREDGNDPDDKAVQQVLRRVKLWETISDKGGLDAQVSKLSLSHDQRQMLCIARACVRKLHRGTRLVVVDEALSGLHPDMDRVARRAIKHYMSDCTIIMVAHRMESLRNVRMTIQMIFESAKVRIHQPQEEDEVSRDRERDRELPPAMKDYGPVEEIPAELEEIVRLSEQGEERPREEEDAGLGASSRQQRQ